jgi:hypothetical protein
MPEIEILHEVTLEALEEVGLAHAIAEGRKSKFVSEEEIFSILGSNVSMPS